MTEIEKMYKLAKVKAINIAEYGSTYIPNSVKIDDEPYPPFTAEKQIELIKLLTQQCDLTISHFTKWEWEFVHYDGQEPLQIKGKDFTETFAKLVNAYWQSLTDQEKEEIRRILNENS